MSTRSAPVGDLVKECRRAAPKMVEAASDHCTALERLTRGGIASGCLEDDGRRLVGHPPVHEALGLVADLGILVMDSDSVRLTAAGDDFVWAWWDFLEEQGT